MQLFLTNQRQQMNSKNTADFDPIRTPKATPQAIPYSFSPSLQLGSPQHSIYNSQRNLPPDSTQVPPSPALSSPSVPSLQELTPPSLPALSSPQEQSFRPLSATNNESPPIGREAATNSLGELKSQTANLFNALGPAVWKEISPTLANRFGPILAQRLGPPLFEHVGIPMVQRIGFPIAQRIFLPLLKKLGGLILTRVGF